MKKLAVIDIDGTITDFYKVDSEIISKLYGKSRLVRLLDKLLWKINSLDLITNRFIIFKLRILLYSLLTGKKYRKSMAFYKREYIRVAKEYLHSFMNIEYNCLKSKGIDVILLTCDPFDAFCGESVTVVQDKFRYVRDNVAEKYDVLNIIGNNYMDDIRIGLKLRDASDISCVIEIFYVGNSSVIKHLVKNKNVVVYSTIKETIATIC